VESSNNEINQTKIASQSGDIGKYIWTNISNICIRTI